MPLLVVWLLASRRQAGARLLMLGLGLLACLGALAALPASIYTPRLVVFLPGFLGVVLVAGYLGIDPARRLDGLVAVALYAAAFLSPVNKPWYLLVPIGLLSVATSARLIAAGVAVSATTLVVALLPLLPGIDATTYQALRLLSLVVQLAILGWACIPLPRLTRERGLRCLGGRGLWRRAPLTGLPT
jgi:hypothetical protein